LFFLDKASSDFKRDEEKLYEECWSTPGEVSSHTSCTLLFVNVQKCEEILEKTIKGIFFSFVIFLSHFSFHISDTLNFRTDCKKKYFSLLQFFKPFIFSRF